MANIININNLNYKNIFNNFNLSIQENTFVALSGANNCGKTTLIRILNKEIDDVSNIFIKGKDINQYKNEEFSRIVQTIIPEEINFIENTLYEELLLQSNGNNELIEFIIKGIKIKKISEKTFSTYSKKDIVLSQLAIALSNQPEILLIDNISPFFTKNEIEGILVFLNEYKKKYSITIIFSTLNLEESLYADNLLIIDNGVIALEGKSNEVLEKDNIINKIGLNIPFMIDLSVKLRDYELVEKIELDKDRMIEELWK